MLKVSYTCEYKDTSISHDLTDDRRGERMHQLAEEMVLGGHT